MDRKKLISGALAMATIAAIIGAAYGATIITYQFYFEVPTQVSATVYLNGEARPDMFILDFGTAELDAWHDAALDVHNRGNVPLVVAVTVTGLPSDWITTYTENGGTIFADEWLNGTIRIFVPSTTAPGSYVATVTVDIGELTV